MNSIVIVATAWLVLGWIGLVLLIVKTPRNPSRHSQAPRPPVSGGRPVLLGRDKWGR
jgi:hypothetical protein